MPKSADTYQIEFDEFVQSLLASHEEGLRHGPVSAKEAKRSGDEAIVRGLRERDVRPPRKRVEEIVDGKQDPSR